MSAFSWQQETPCTGPRRRWGWGAWGPNGMEADSRTLRTAQSTGCHPPGPSRHPTNAEMEAQRGKEEKNWPGSPSYAVSLN